MPFKERERKREWPFENVFQFLVENHVKAVFAADKAIFFFLLGRGFTD